MENSHYFHHVELFNTQSFLCHSIFNNSPIKTENYVADDNINVSPDDAYRGLKNSMGDEREETLHSRHSV